MSARILTPAAVLFDLDGTLADSFVGIQYALNAALREQGSPERELAWVKRHVGRGAVELVRDVFPGDEEARLRSFASRFASIYRETYLERTTALAGAAEVLALVHARTGGRVAVVSNKYEDLSRMWLQHAGLEPFVAVVVGPDTYGVRKPDPGALRPVLDAFGVEAHDALVVGDMEVDVAAARAVGARCVGIQADAAAAVALRYAGAAAVLGGLGELPTWLAENGAGWGYHGFGSGEGR